MSRVELKPPIAAEKMIGVLGLQGDVCEHLDHLERLGVAARTVKQAEDLEDLVGMILPGGESTCLARLLRIFNIDKVIIRKFHEGMKLWGTCAGAILLAKSITGEAPHLGLIDIEITRNSFGSQLDSFASEASIPELSPTPIPLTFIRAPKIIRVGAGVDVLLRIGDFIAAAESPGVLVTIFHPELTPSLAFHRYFARKCGLRPGGEEAAIHPSWDKTSWMRLARITPIEKRSAEPLAEVLPQEIDHETPEGI
ncbi:MAG: pyridoxal 5'-phosphate synthase glutaminase subunit PdxT [Deltaproteobacteria bacterium]|nr:pyridoxal 5'-phosphate synthase glutaminase subunit PdxT [Deltaproteobacteria bacterium]